MKDLYTTNLILIIVIFSLISNISSSFSHTDSKGRGGLIVGTWYRSIKDRNPTITFSSDGKFEVDFTNSYEADVYGTYTDAHNNITLKDDGGTHACDFVTGGFYNYTISINQITFTLIKDNCKGRVGVIVGTWTKQSPLLILGR
jgi:hypothetical protein